MSTTTKPRRGLRIGKLTNQAMALEMEAAAAPPTPEAVQAQAWALCKRVSDLLADASQIGESGGVYDTITDAAHTYLERVMDALAVDHAITTKAADHAVSDVLSANIVLMGARALKPQESQDLLTKKAMGCISKVAVLLDRPRGFWPKAPAVDTFQAGRDLAMALLRDADRVGRSQDDTPEAWRCYRHGGAQNRFAQPHLAKLIARPELLDGFSALLSCWLYQSWAGWPDPEQLTNLPAAEFEAGVSGADGTKSDPENVRQGV